ncbi:MAG: BA14K family protein [Pseudomonadota bacterium]
MGFPTQLIAKTIKSLKMGLAALAALGTVTVTAPQTASADTYRHFNGHVGVHGGKAFRGHRKFHGHRKYRGHRNFKHRRNFSAHRFHGGRHHYRGHRRYKRHRGNGAAVAAGIIGLTAGAIIASQAHKSHRRNRVIRHSSFEPFTPEWYAACARKYRSFNPETGRFLSYSGKYRLCRI